MLLGPPPRTVVPTLWFWLALSGLFVSGALIGLGMYAAGSSERSGLNGLMRLGQKTEGRIESIQTVQKGRARRVEASYRAAGQTWRSYDEIPTEETGGLVEGGPIPVTYLPSSPNQAHVGELNFRTLEKQASEATASFFALGAVMTIGSGLLVWLYLNNRKWLVNRRAFPGRILETTNGGTARSQYVAYQYEWTSDRLRNGTHLVSFIYSILLAGKEEVTILEGEVEDSRIAEALIWAKVVEEG
ncbi:DUF3592 domain-containing protein [bacterium]|nr:MAG: DUF3592 domain-containing protein [bacterium]